MKTGTLDHIHRMPRWIRSALYYVIWLLILTVAFGVLWVLQNHSRAQNKKYNGARFVYAEQWSEDHDGPSRDAYLPAVQSQHRI